MTIKLYKYTKTLVEVFIRHLWLSISSVQFYQDVYSRYKGYGINYLFVTSFIASLFLGSMFLNYIVDIRGYFVNGDVKPDAANIDYIISQLPDIYYDGDTIQIEEETPLIIKDLHSREVLAIDPKNELQISKKNQMPIIFLSNQVRISPVKFQKKSYIITKKYQDLAVFGEGHKVITSDNWKDFFAKVFDNMPGVFIYMVYPLLLVMCFMLAFGNFTFIFTLISTYLLSYFLLQNTSFKKCFRMVSFASGVGIAFAPIVLLTIPEDIGLIIVSFLQSWPIFLLFLSILKIRNSRLP